MSIEKLCSFFGNPQDRIAFVHVAGTNGKGSVCTKIAAALQEGGFKTGLYTSPHISSFRERIKINGEMISEEEIASLRDEIGTGGIYFEMATLAALLYFERKKVDIAVFETGLGGQMRCDEYHQAARFGHHLDRARPHRDLRLLY